MPLSRIAAKPQSFYLSIQGLNGDALATPHLGLVAVESYSLGMNAVRSGSSFTVGFASEQLTLSFSNDDALAWFTHRALTGTQFTGTLFGGGNFGIETSWRDSMVLSLGSARVVSVIDDIDGGFTASVEFSIFELDTRDLLANGLLSVQSQIEAHESLANLNVSPESATKTAPIGQIGLPTHFYFSASGLSGPISGGGLSNLFEAIVDDVSILKPGIANPTVSALTVRLPEGETALDSILGLMAAGTHLTQARVLGYSNDGQVYRLTIGDVVITAVDLSNPGEFALTLGFATAEWLTVNLDPSGNPVRFDTATADLQSNIYSLGAPPVSPIPADFTPVSAGSVVAPERYFVSVAGWTGDTTTGPHAGLFEAASVDLPALQKSGSAINGESVRLVFATQDSAARFFDAMAGNAILPAVSVYGSALEAAGLRDVLQFDLAGAKVTSVTTRGAFTEVELSYSAFEATVFPLDSVGNPLAPVSRGLTLATGATTTVPDAPSLNLVSDAHAPAPTNYFITLNGITGNQPLQFQTAGTLNSLLVDNFIFTGSRGGFQNSLTLGSVTVELPDGMIYLPKLEDIAAKGQTLSTATIFGYAPQGLAYQLDLASVRIESVNPDSDGSVIVSLVPAQYTIRAFNYNASGQATVAETSGYNGSTRVATAYSEATPADQSAYPTAATTRTAADPEKYYVGIAGWTGDADGALHPGLFEATSVSLPSVGRPGSQAIATELTLNFANLDGLGNFVGALSSGAAIDRVALFGSGLFGGTTEVNSLRLTLTEATVSSVSLTSIGYSVNLSYSAYAIETKAFNSSGLLVTAVSPTGYDLKTQTTFSTLTGTSSQPTDGGNNAAPATFFFQASEVTGTFSTPDTGNLLPVQTYSFNLSRIGSTVSAGTLNLVFNSSGDAVTDFLYLMTRATLVSQANLYGYDDAGRVFDLALGNVRVASVSTNDWGSNGRTSVSLEVGSFTVGTVDLSTAGVPVRSQIAGYNFATATATTFSEIAIATIPAPFGELNPAPTAQPDAYDVDGQISVAGGVGLFANDSDPEGQVLVSLALLQSPVSGSLVLSANGGFTYAANAGFSGYDSFSYQADDVFGARSAPVVVNLTVYLPGATPGDDTIVGTASGDLMRGLAGNDTLRGGDGNDTIYGGTGANSIEGENGNDRLVLGSGADGSNVSGGSGTDALVVNGAVAPGALAGLEAIELVGGASLTLSAAQFNAGFYNPIAQVGMATVSGTGSLILNLDPNPVTAALYLTSLSFVPGSSVTLTLNGTSGLDAIKGAPGVANTINGGDEADQIRGGSLADTINGGNGNDKLFGWSGADVLTGGAGSDQFRYFFATDSGTGAAADRITDFQIGTDKFNFVIIDADAITPDDQAFAFLGTVAFTSPGTGQIRYQDSGADLLVQVDVDGNGTVDMEVVLQGLAGQALTSGDFML